jgi:hypothetical protein
MELLLVITTILVALLLLDAFAVGFGADSREPMLDDWAR